MGEEKLLTIREVAQMLGISEKEVIELSESGKIPAYKIGGVYLRFKREQVEGLKRSYNPLSAKASVSEKISFKDKISDFFYFNDFYIVSALIIIFILFLIFKL